MLKNTDHREFTWNVDFCSCNWNVVLCLYYYCTIFHEKECQENANYVFVTKHIINKLTLMIMSWDLISIIFFSFFSVGIHLKVCIQIEKTNIHLLFFNDHCYHHPTLMCSKPHISRYPTWMCNTIPIKRATLLEFSG